VAITKNAVLVTGLDRDAKKTDKTAAGLCAVSLEDGKLLWKQPLLAAPTAWCLALDRAGRIVVTLQDGRVLCFDAE
jgi:outer membrane protein assembly factor BamB